jgi:glycosyltransferase involved in cell wall biosynthesis
MGSIVPWGGGHPARRFGQVGLMRIPPGDAIVFFHQSHPLTRKPSISFVLDTIQVRFGGSWLARAAKRIYLMFIIRSAARILTISAFSKESIVKDLRASPSRVRVASIPVGGSRFDAIAQSRASSSFKNQALYIGRFARHKNIEGMVRGFVLSDFAREGGRLIMVGVSDAEVEPLARDGVFPDRSVIEAIPSCSETRLDDLLAESQMLLLPSFEEGFGLPAFEAAAVGMPVVATRTGGIPELPAQVVDLCEPDDPASIASAIDRAAMKRGISPAFRHAGDLGEVLRDTVQEVVRRG